MTNLRTEVLLRRFADNTISREEYLELISYFKLSGDNKEIHAALDKIWAELNIADIELTDGQQQKAFEKITADERFKPTGAKVRTLRRWLPYAAAAVILAVGAGSYLVFQKQSADTIAQRYKNDVAPGANKATLTLANGKVINLNNAAVSALAAQSGARISKNHNGELVYSFTAAKTGKEADFNIVTTPTGGQYQIVLADGSHVWLNASSSLRFPVQFTGHERRVTLKGEAYFEVAKNVDKPFRVVTAEQLVEVHGTHFDINGYPDEPAVLTTLLEGAVSINYNGKTTPIVPGEQARVTAAGIKVQTVDTEEAVAWKNGLFMYTNQNLESIMKQAARWYDIDVAFEDEALKSQVFSGSISRFKNISQLLEVLESTGSVHFKIDGRRLTAMK